VDYRLRPIRLIQWAAPRAALWVALWAMTVCAGMAAEQSYTVKRGDTAFGIAQRYGVTTSALAERNGLGRNPHIYAGQRLIIPGKAPAQPKVSAKTTAKPKSARMALPRTIQRAIDKAPVRAGRWKCIVIHHSGTDTGTMRTLDKYHREVRHMEHGLAYNFVIGNGSGMGDGEIGVSRRWTLQLDGGHLASEAQNKVALGICLVGNFDKRRPTSRQMESLRALVEALMARCQLVPSAVKTHQQINVVHTRCPGAQFPTRSFLDSLQARGR
jgi:murein DD-endopeptidase MepM/ murein hydrolase activator NlpD